MFTLNNKQISRPQLLWEMVSLGKNHGLERKQAHALFMKKNMNDTGQSNSILDHLKQVSVRN